MQFSVQVALVKFPTTLNLSDYNYKVKIITEWRPTVVRIGRQMS